MFSKYLVVVLVCFSQGTTSTTVGSTYDAAIDVHTIAERGQVAGIIAPSVQSRRMGSFPHHSGNHRRLLDASGAPVAGNITIPGPVPLIKAPDDSSGWDPSWWVILLIVIGGIAFIVCHIVGYIAIWKIYKNWKKKRDKRRGLHSKATMPRLGHEISSGAGSGSSDSAEGPIRSGEDPNATHDVIAVAIQELKKELQVEQLQVHDLIARGGFGAVYRGTWRQLAVAVKTVVFQGIRPNDASMKRAVAEASIAYNLDHPNIVATYSHELKPLGDTTYMELASWKLYLIQELCNGGTLSDLVDAGMLARNGRIQMVRVLSLLFDIAKGMTHVHAKRIAHGDLNPNNILLQVPEADVGVKSWRATSERVATALDQQRCTAKVTDFGLSIRLDAGASHVSNIRQGTPFYCAPEITSHARLLPESDVFSFGVIMWGLVHNCAPYVHRDGILERHPNFPAFQQYVPLNYTLLSIACMSKEPQARPSFEQISTVLASICDELATGHYIDARGYTQVQDNIELSSDFSAAPGTQPNSNPTPIQSLVSKAAISNSAAFKTASEPQSTLKGLKTVSNSAVYTGDGSEAGGVWLQPARLAAAGWCSVEDICSQASSLGINTMAFMGPLNAHPPHGHPLHIGSPAETVEPSSGSNARRSWINSLVASSGSVTRSSADPTSPASSLVAASAPYGAEQPRPKSASPPPSGSSPPTPELAPPRYCFEGDRQLRSLEPEGGESRGSGRPRSRGLSFNSARSLLPVVDEGASGSNQRLSLEQ